MDLTVHNGETERQYIWRLHKYVENGEMTWQDLADCVNKNFRESEDEYRCESAYRKPCSAAIAYFNDVFSKLDVDPNSIDEIEKKLTELRKERFRLSDKKRELNALERKQARFDNLREMIETELKKIEPFNFECICQYHHLDVEASLILSDWHYGIEIANIVNHYDTYIARQRIQKLITKVETYCRLNKVNTLNIEVIGDMCSGHINIGNRVEQEEDIIAQIIQVSELISDMIHTFAKTIPNVRVYCVYGNHSRAIADKRSSIMRENFERLIFEYIKLRCPQIQVITSGDDDFLPIEICGKRVVLCHGNNDNENNAVKNYVNILDYKPDEIHMGHYHNFGINNDNDCEIIVNGSLVGTDDYALGLRKATKPSQVLRIYDEDTCTYNILV